MTRSDTRRPRGRAGFLAGVRRRRGRLAAVGLPLATLQAALLVTSAAHHDHREDALLSPDLPADYHHHDFQLQSGSEVGVGYDDCLGCRLERSPAAPTARAASFAGVPVDPVPARGPAIGWPGSLDDPHPPRAPPLS